VITSYQSNRFRIQGIADKWQQYEIDGVTEEEMIQLVSEVLLAISDKGVLKLEALATSEYLMRFGDLIEEASHGNN
jgi:hypothetical protein